jgi:hypothetical protein
VRTSAFSLVELLVVITIIVVLLALLAPALDSAMEAGTRAVCAANMRTWSLTCTQYAMDHRKAWPVGTPEGTTHAQNPWQADGMSQFRWETWVTLHEQYGLQEEGSICASIGLLPHFWKPYNDVIFGDPTKNFLFSTFPGLTYWGSRKEVAAVNYQFPRKLGDEPTSRTLVTCYCYSDPRWTSYAPHTREGARTFPAGTVYDPVPLGLAVGYTDVSARWVDWADLIELSYGSLYYYDGR